MPELTQGPVNLKSISVESRDALNISILVVFAISQPIFSFLANNPLFFVARQSNYREIAFFTFVLAALIPCLAALTYLLASRTNRFLGRVVGALLIGMCAFLFLAPLLNKLNGIGGNTFVLLNLSCSVVITALYICLPVIRTFTTYLLPALVIFPISFLFDTGIQNAVGKSSVSSERPVITKPVNVVIFLFDALPVHSLLDEKQEIDAARYPNISKLSKESSWYRYASTVNSSTGWAVPSLLTGRELHGTAPLPYHHFFPNNLFTALGHQYELHVTEYISKLCPTEFCQIKYRSSSAYIENFIGLLSDVSFLYLHSLVPAEFSGFLPRIGETFGGFSKGNIESGEHLGRVETVSPGIQAEEFISAFKRDDTPQLHFLHVLIPHAPWRYLPSGKDYGNGYYAQIHGLNGLSKEWSADSWAINVAYQRHLLQVAFVDKIVGQAIQKLKDIDLYDETMFIVLSDHGSSYKANNNHRHLTEGNKSDLIGIPLFIKYPYQDGGITDDRNVSIIDVLPTILDQLGADIPWPMDGSSLVSGQFPDRTGKRIWDVHDRVFETAADFYADATTIHDKLRLFATGGPIDDLFNISLMPSLNGIQLSDIELVPSHDEFLVSNPNQFADVDLESNYLPAFVSGEAPSLKAGTALALALNGKVVTVSRVFYGATGRHDFAAMLPESEFRQGRNTLSIHRVGGKEGDHSLFQSRIMALDHW